MRGGVGGCNEVYYLLDINNSAGKHNEGFNYDLYTLLSSMVIVSNPLLKF